MKLLKDISNYEIIGYSRKGNPYIGHDKDGERLYLLVCEFCEEKFTNKHPNVKFCSDKCRRKRDAKRREKLRVQSEKIIKNTAESQEFKRESKSKRDKRRLDISYQSVVDRACYEHYEILNVDELEYKGDSDNRVSVTVSNIDLNRLTFINLIGSFFHKYNRLPNNDDMILLPGKKQRRRIYKLHGDFNSILDLVLNRFNSQHYYDNPHSIKKCCCGELFSEYHSNYNSYCSKQCFDVNERTNVCVICKSKFVGITGYDNVCQDCRDKSGDMAGVTSICDRDKRDLISEVTKGRVLDILDKSQGVPNTFNGIEINYYNISGFTESVKDEVRERDNFMCRICGRDVNLHVHHIIPRKRGGNHDINNLILLCSSCHRAIETGDEAHAIKKCTKNSLVHGGYTDVKNGNFSSSEAINILVGTLEKTFTELSHDTEYSEVLTYIDNTLESLGF